jgi:hypothetical protein
VRQFQRRRKLERFLAFIDNEIEEGLAKLEKAQIHLLPKSAVISVLRYGGLTPT